MGNPTHNKYDMTTYTTYLKVKHRVSAANWFVTPSTHYRKNTEPTTTTTDRPSLLRGQLTSTEWCVWSGRPIGSVCLTRRAGCITPFLTIYVHIPDSLFRDGISQSQLFRTNWPPWGTYDYASKAWQKLQKKADCLDSADIEASCLITVLLNWVMIKFARTCKEK